MKPDTITTTEAAALLKVSRRHVRHLIATGVLPAVLFGRDWLIKRADIAAAKHRPGRGRPKKTDTKTL